MVNGVAITFDCKCTMQSRLPLGNIEQHQLLEASECEQHGGLAFWVIEYVGAKNAGIYRVPHQVLLAIIGEGRKRIPHYLMLPDWRVQSRNGIVLDYLAGLYEARRVG